MLFKQSILHYKQKLLNFEEENIRKSMSNWYKVFKNGPSEVCGRQPLKHLNIMLKQTISLQMF